MAGAEGRRRLSGRILTPAFKSIPRPPIQVSMMGLSARRVLLLLLIPVALVGGAVLATATFERSTALHSSAQTDAGQRMLTAMLDQETGARGYFQTGEERFLEPWYQGRTAFTTALRHARSLASGDAPLLGSLDLQAAQAQMWRLSVSATIDRLRRQGIHPGASLAIRQKSMMDQFRRLNALYAAQITMRRDRALTAATWLAAGVAALLSVILVLAGIWFVRRLSGRESARIRRQQELSELLQASVSERESQELLIRHVQRLAPGATAAVLERNNSDDRLEPVLPENAGALSALGDDQLRPRSCMAIRLSRRYESAPGDDALVSCEACGKVGTGVACEPLLVGGHVIGSVLIARGRPLDEAERADVRDAVLQAAPILSNQRDLALAERRAASDALTGLPNRRAADETLKRMAAHAGRAVTPLSAVLLDLDHFKQINDLHGHDRGDEALAVVGQLIVSTIRTSDFAARFGGEEFLLLLPDTDGAGAVEVCEKLRRAVETAEVGDIPSITASFGVATLPDDAADPETLLRRADRALYAAKALGRNRVQIAEPLLSEESGDGAQAAGDAPAGADAR